MCATHVVHTLKPCIQVPTHEKADSDEWNSQNTTCTVVSLGDHKNVVSGVVLGDLLSRMALFVVPVIATNGVALTVALGDHHKAVSMHQ